MKGNCCRNWNVPRILRLAIVPIAQFRSAHDAGESNTIIKTRTVVGRLRMYADKDENSKNYNGERLERSPLYEVVEVLHIEVLN